MSSLHRYRTEIPNLIDEMDLSVYAFRLYVRLKRVAGDSGKCFYSTRQLAEQCRMSVGAVSKAKQELLAADLIRIESDGEWERDNITIVDLWPANFTYFAQEKVKDACSPHEQQPEKSCSPHEQAAPPLCSPHEQSVHHMNTPVHHMNTKEEPYKERTNKKEPKGESAPAPTTDVEFIDGKPVTAQQTMYVALCEALGWDYRLIVPDDQVSVAETVKALSKAGYGVGDVRRFMTEVWFKDWRWEKRGERPKLKDIRQGIGTLRLGTPEQVPRPQGGKMAPVDRGKAAADELRAMLLANGKGDILG